MEDELCYIYNSNGINLKSLTELKDVFRKSENCAPQFFVRDYTNKPKAITNINIQQIFNYDINELIKKCISQGDKNIIQLVNKQYSNEFAKNFDYYLHNPYGVPLDTKTIIKAIASIGYYKLYQMHELCPRQFCLKYGAMIHFNGIRKFSASKDGRFFDDLFTYLRDFLGPSADIYSAIYLLSKATNSSIENLIQMTSERYNHQLINNDDLICTAILKKWPIPKDLLNSNEDKYINIVDTHEIRGGNGSLVGAFLLADLDDRSIIFPATVVNNKLTVAEYRPTSYPFNLDRILKYPNAKIIFFVNPITAAHFNRDYKFILDSQNDYIITTFLGNDPSVWRWSYFINRDVYFVFSLDKNQIASAKKYESCISTTATSIKFYGKFLITEGKICDKVKNINIDNFPQDEKMILNRVKGVRDIENCEQFIYDIINNSYDLKSFIKDFTNIGVFKNENKTLFCSTVYKALETKKEEKPQSAKNINDVTLSHFIRPNFLTLIEAEKNSGKTRLAYSICASIIHGDKLFNKINNFCKEKVTYIDCETPFDEIESMKEEYKLNDKLFLCFAKKDDNFDMLPDFIKSFDLNDEEFRSGLKDHLIKNKCKYLFLDNLKGLMDDKVNIDSAASSVYEWIETLLQLNVSIVIIHHLNIKGNKSASESFEAGSKKFRTHAQTIIHIENKKTILKNNLGNDSVQKIVLEDGLTMGVCFKVCKHAPIIEEKTLWLHQEFNDVNMIPIAMTDLNNIEVDAFNKNQEEGVEEQIINHIKKYGKIQTSNARKYTDQCANTTKKILNAMVEKRLIEHNGASNRESAYILPEDGN